MQMSRHNQFFLFVENLQPTIKPYNAEFYRQRHI